MTIQRWPGNRCAVITTENMINGCVYVKITLKRHSHIVDYIILRREIHTTWVAVETEKIIRKVCQFNAWLLCLRYTSPRQLKS